MIKEESRFADSVIFEGMTSIRAVLSAASSNYNSRRIRSVLYDQTKQHANQKELAYLRKTAEQQHFSLQAVSPEELCALTVGSSHGGIIALCSDRQLPSVSVECYKPNGFWVMIEGIEDPYNFGYALRSIYAAGADAVILPRRNWMSAAGVVCRSSAGASELLPLYVADSAQEAVLLAHQAGYRVVCAGIRDSVSAFEADLHLPLLLIVGGEKRGISRTVLDQADAVVRLDYGREFRGSLSAASAASILAYEVLRQNQSRIFRQKS